VLVKDLVQLGELIRGRRIELELSQTELATQVGATRQWISRLEKGRHDISTARLFTLLDALELNLDIRRPRPAGASTAELPDMQSILPAAALKAIREMPMQIPVPGLSGLNFGTSRDLEGSKGVYPDFTESLAQILESNARTSVAHRRSEPFAELTAADAEPAEHSEARRDATERESERPDASA
jgi:transcriptional regulator with XRE-family HTH domain